MVSTTKIITYIYIYELACQRIRLQIALISIRKLHGIYDPLLKGE